MKVHFIYVGQGDSIYIKTAAGDDIFIDGGNKDGSDVVAYLKKQKVKDIEVMISITLMLITSVDWMKFLKHLR